MTFAGYRDQPTWEKHLVRIATREDLPRLCRNVAIRRSQGSLLGCALGEYLVNVCSYILQPLSGFYTEVRIEGDCHLQELLEFSNCAHDHNSRFGGLVNKTILEALDRVRKHSVDERTAFLAEKLRYRFSRALRQLRELVSGVDALSIPLMLKAKGVRGLSRRDVRSIQAQCSVVSTGLGDVVNDIIEALEIAAALGKILRVYWHEDRDAMPNTAGCD